MDAPSPIASARLDVSRLAERMAADAAIATGIARIVSSMSAAHFVPDLQNASCQI